MYVLVTYKDEENQMKNEGARVVKHYTTVIYFRRSRAVNSVAGGWVWWKNQNYSNFYGSPCYLQE